MSAADLLAAERANRPKPRRRVYVEVTATVSLSEVSTDDLIEELEDRGDRPSVDVEAIAEHGNELFLAFNMRDEARALKVARELCEVLVGRIIP